MEQLSALIKVMKRIDKIIIYSIFIIPTILLFGYAFWTAFSGESAHEIAAKRNVNEAFFGRVDTLYFEVQNHNIKIAELNNSYKCQIFRLWERYIEVGDSLSKKEGSFLLGIHKINGEVISLDYRDTF